MDVLSDNFLRSVNHEFRGPLMSLTNCIEILKYAKLDADTSEAVAEIERQVATIGQIVDNRLWPLSEEAISN